MTKNLTAVLTEPGSIVLEEREVPAPGPHEVLVEIRSVGVCGSDVHYYEHGRIGDFVVRQPLVLGHEASGVVVQIGTAVTQVREGERVAIEPGWPDGTCEYCLSGRYNLCPNVHFLATPPVDGAFTRLLLVPEQFAHSVPAALSDDAAALIEPLSVGIAACRKASVQAGSRVLVTGAGPVGLLVGEVARASGATTVVVLEPNSKRRARAIEVSSADVRAVEDLRADEQFDAFIECSGAVAAIRTGLDCLKPGGTAVLVGMGADEATLPITKIQVKELIITGTFRYANSYPQAIALAASGRFDLDALVDARFGLHEVELALKANHEDPTLLKVVVSPGA
ncbi:MAG: NAD(P)-dependent alcohol dehydrogenase [Actinobacteria bacterium]|nr:NAD(P)-dependent alcohol dehydrogenase [Actinomycetota bacterium]